MNVYTYAGHRIGILLVLAAALVVAQYVSPVIVWAVVAIGYAIDVGRYRR